jgi:hypothetical protein
MQLLFNACSESVDASKDQISDLTQLQKTLTVEVVTRKTKQLFLILDTHFIYFFLKEIKINVILFLLAGFETTSTTLGNCIHVLTKHPEELKKLQEEIDSNLRLEVCLINQENG